VKLVDLATRKVVRNIDVRPFPFDPGGFGVIVDGRFADDGRTILVNITPNAPKGLPPFLRRFEARTGRSLGPGVRIGRRAAGPAPTVPSQRDRLLFSGWDGNFVVDAATLRVRRRIPGGASSTGVSPDGQRAALGGEDGSVAILDLRTGERRTLRGRHEDRVRALAFSADGRTLATTAGDGRVLVWDLRSGEVRETLTGHTGAVNTLEVSGDGHTLYTAGLDGRVIVWDIVGDRRLARPFRAGGQNSGYPPPLAISPSGRTVAAGLPDGGVRLHDARTLRRLRELPGIEDRPVAAVEFSPGGRSIAVTGLAGTVELRDAATGRRMRPPLRLGAPAQAMAFSPDGGRLAVADIEGNLRLLDLRSGKVRRAPRLGGFTAHLAYDPDGRMLAIGLAERGTELRDGRSLQLVARLPHSAGEDGGWVRFSPDGRLLAVTSSHYTQLWDVAKRRRIGPPLRGHEGLVFTSEFSPDGRTLATSGSDGSVILWDVESRRSLGKLPGRLGQISSRFTPDGQRLFVLHELGAAQRWEVGPDAWSKHACRVAGRELTRAEWDELVPDQDYRAVCS
jgi:WD40 repeat protein